MQYALSFMEIDIYYSSRMICQCTSIKMQRKGCSMFNVISNIEDMKNDHEALEYNEKSWEVLNMFSIWNYCSDSTEMQLLSVLPTSLVPFLLKSIGDCNFLQNDIFGTNKNHAPCNFYFYANSSFSPTLEDSSLGSLSDYLPISLKCERWRWSRKSSFLWENHMLQTSFLPAT